METPQLSFEVRIHSRRLVRISGARPTLPFSKKRVAVARSRSRGSPDRVARNSASVLALRHLRLIFRKPAPGCNARLDESDRGAPPAGDAAAPPPVGPFPPKRFPDSSGPTRTEGRIQQLGRSTQPLFRNFLVRSTASRN